MVPVSMTSSDAEATVTDFNDTHPHDLSATAELLVNEIQLTINTQQRANNLIYSMTIYINNNCFSL